jgi:hypothetical protein
LEQVCGQVLRPATDRYWLEGPLKIMGTPVANPDQVRAELVSLTPAGCDPLRSLWRESDAAPIQRDEASVSEEEIAATRHVLRLILAAWPDRDS